VNPLPAGWGVKSMTAGGRDVLDLPIELKGGEDLRDVLIVLTDRTAELNGMVRDAAGEAVTTSVLIFADDRRQLPGRARWVKPDHLGRFAVSGLPPGNYLVALADEVDDLRWSTNEYLDQFRSQATRVTLADAEKKSIALQRSDSR